jgi:hypothetical protein
MLSVMLFIWIECLEMKYTIKVEFYINYILALHMLFKSSILYFGFHFCSTLMGLCISRLHLLFYFISDIVT